MCGCRHRMADNKADIVSCYVVLYHFAPPCAWCPSLFLSLHCIRLVDTNDGNRLGHRTGTSSGGFVFQIHAVSTSTDGHAFSYGAASKVRECSCPYGALYDHPCIHVSIHGAATARMTIRYRERWRTVGTVGSRCSGMNDWYILSNLHWLQPARWSPGLDDVLDMLACRSCCRPKRLALPNAPPPRLVYRCWPRMSPDNGFLDWIHASISCCIIFSGRHCPFVVTAWHHRC